MSDLQTMTYEVDERIVRITLDRPERGNGLTPTLIEAGFREAARERDDPFGDPGASSFKG
jgi:enoyl-CoA hydratase/carnithine racemase